MVFISWFEGIILALLLLSFALQTLSVHALHHQERRLFKGNTIEETQENDAYLTKEYGIGSRTKIEVRMGGRKMGMILKEELGEEEMGGGSRSSRGELAQKKKKQMNVKAGFVAFTADYHMAKRHPPKNN